jgi:outer membrane cobalamin receptor
MFEGGYKSVSRAGASIAALAIALAASPATAQTSANSATDPAQAASAPPSGPEEAEIVVTGFRASLDAAINVKRNSISSVDAIVAEDIAKFPDQNLAESLQRVPGISIQRDAGEGRAITVRGLGAQFTRVRVNGLETVATATDGATGALDGGPKGLHHVFAHGLGPFARKGAFMADDAVAHQGGMIVLD